MQIFIYMLNSDELLLIGVNITITRLFVLLAADSQAKKDQTYIPTSEKPLASVGESSAMGNSLIDISAFKELIIHGH